VPVFYSLFDDAAQSPAWGRVARAWEHAAAGVRRVVGRAKPHEPVAHP
jgi:hypothetical protein